MRPRFQQAECIVESRGLACNRPPVCVQHKMGHACRQNMRTRVVGACQATRSLQHQSPRGGFAQWCWRVFTAAVCNDGRLQYPPGRGPSSTSLRCACICLSNGIIRQRLPSLAQLLTLNPIPVAPGVIQCQKQLPAWRCHPLSGSSPQLTFRLTHCSAVCRPPRLAALPSLQNRYGTWALTSSPTLTNVQLTGHIALWCHHRIQTGWPDSDSTSGSQRACCHPHVGPEPPLMGMIHPPPQPPHAHSHHTTAHCMRHL